MRSSSVAGGSPARPAGPRVTWAGGTGDSAAGASGLFFEETKLPALRSYVALWLVLAAITLTIISVPNLPVAIYEPQLTSALGAVSGVIGLALLQLGILRFRLLRRSLDLHAGLAFGVLALGNLFAVWARGPTKDGSLPLELPIYVLLLVRATAAVLFLTGLARTVIGPPLSRSALSTLTRPVLVVALGWGIVLGMRAHAPVLLDATARELLNSTVPVADILHGQSPALIAANTTIAAALGIAAIGYTVAARRLLDPYLSALAAGLALLFFGQLQAILVPAMATDYVSTGDAFRLVAYGLLMSNLVWRTAADVAEHTARDERLRLSQELHDGLAQELAALRLRLARAAELTSPNGELAHSVEVAQRLLEGASLEARQAIAALRAGPSSWEALDQVLTDFAHEFSQNHDIEVRLVTEPGTGTPSIGGLRGADLLRIVHEACSNAIRHGGARRIEVRLAAMSGTLHLAIRDNGQGFDPAHMAPGVGLRSMAERVKRQSGRLAIESAPGQGTAVYVWFPLSGAASR
jgi:signal transduction histidine kinase